MMKRIALILALMLLCCGCTAEMGKALPFPAEADAILLTDGSGNTVTVTDPDTVAELTAMFADLRYKRQGKVESDGWYCNLQWQKEGSTQMSVSLADESGHRILYEGHYWLVTADRNIDTEELAKLTA